MTDVSAFDVVVFAVVLGARLLAPLAIPRYPLPAILAAFLIDGVDETIFQRFTDLNLDFYQSYDKSLDIYYLVIAYISTLQNWTHLFAFEVSRFLLYYRLVGVIMFELSQLRVMLLIFPNSFEYFFDFYEGVRARWDPRRMSRRLVLGAAVFVWVVIKLPQEYIIHVAKVDTTDWIRNNVFGVEVTASWGEALANRPLVTAVLIAALTALFIAARWVLTHRLPPADYKLRLAADPIPVDLAERSRQIASAPRPLRLTDPALIEKVALVSLVCIMFAQVLPGVDAGVIAVTLGVTIAIVANTALSTWLTRRGVTWTSVVREFLALAAFNTVLVLGYAVILPSSDGSINIGNTLFFALLLTLIITLYDRYRPIHLARFAASAGQRHDAAGAASVEVGSEAIVRSVGTRP